MTIAPLTVDVTGWMIASLDAALDSRVAAQTPVDLQSQVPLVRVVRIGGPDDGVILDEPTFGFHCFASDQAGANALGYQVIRAVYDMRGKPSTGAVMTAARKLSGPSWANVEDQNLAHAVVLMQARIKTTG
jgi:hypothetical protein